MAEEKLVNLTIDGKKCQVPAGTTIHEAAGQVNINIPVICLHEGTTAEGICRQCVVEIDGWGRLAPSCITPVAEGMVVETDNERVNRSRRTILEMLNASVDISRSPALLKQMERYSADADRFPGAKKRGGEVLDDNPFYVRDYSQCILCWRCVQVCADDMQYTYALGLGGRGHDSRVATFFDNPMPDTTCVFCGNCVGVCPTKALQGKTEYLLEQGLQHDEIRARRRQERKGIVVTAYYHDFWFMPAPFFEKCGYSRVGEITEVTDIGERKYMSDKAMLWKVFDDSAEPPGFRKQNYVFKPQEGKVVIFDVDVKGGVNLKKIFGENALSIFIAPPSIDELERRLISRATDDLETIKTRVAKAKEEMTYAEEFDQIIINDDLETAQKEIERIVRNFIEE